MKNPERHRRIFNIPPIILSLVVFLLLVAIGELGLSSAQSREAEIIKANLFDSGNLLSQRIQQTVLAAVSSTSTLQVFLEIGDYEVQRFEDWAAAIMQDNPSLGALELAPGGVVQHIYPLEGNEGAMGHDLLADQRRDDGALKAIESREITFVGPIKLIQNDKYAIIARNPVFRSSEGGEDFWGFTIALLLIEDIFREINPMGIEDDLAMILMGDDPDAESRPVFFQSAEYQGVDEIQISIEVPNGRWILGIHDAQDYPNRALQSRALLYPLTILIAAAVFIGQSRLKKQTARIHEINGELISVNKALRRKQDEADELQRERGMFFSRITHELRTPLNALLGLSEALAETDLNAHQREYVETFQRSGQDLLHLINDLLDFGKIEQTEFQLEKSVFTLKGLFEAQDKLFGEMIRRKGLHWHVEFDESCTVSVIGDPHRLGQVLRNLVSNSYKFTKSGEISLSARSANRDEHFISYTIEVQDSGVGISAERQREIHKPFARSDADTDGKYSGTGLGLSICELILEKMNSRMQIKSTRGIGSTFTFEITLPVSPQDGENEKAGDSGTGKTPQATGDHPERDLSGMRILVAEDSPPNQLVLKAYLESWNASFRITEDGSEALQALKQETFDLILMDLEMPGLDGIAALGRIRESALEHDSPPIPPVIAMTAYSEAEMMRRIEKASFDGHLTKPFSKEMLYRTIEAYSKGGRGFSRSG
jgi:signal transduction histidine kinase/ActR/RegA family two-component response regulator